MQQNNNQNYINRGNSQKNNEQVAGKTFFINEQIKAKEVRVIDQNGEMLGIMATSEAIIAAKDVDLDLIEVSPNANPPVCKITNFNKMRYELQKKASDARKKQKVVETKEVKMSINIGKNDFDVKIKQVAKFIENGDKVRISIKMKGREITHLDLAKEMMHSIIEKTALFAKAELGPKLEGSQMVVILVKNK